MFVFWVNTGDGRVATYDQLEKAGLVEGEKPVSPWYAIQGPSDASTMWYSVLRRKTKGVYIGTLCFRHTPRQASLEQAGWREVPIEEIGLNLTSAKPGWQGRRDEGVLGTPNPEDPARRA